MGYNLTIGEAEIERDDDYIRISAVRAVDMDAPDHCEFTKQGNSRSPSYSAWSEFCQEAGISTLFYGSGWNRQTCSYDPPPDSFHRESVYLANHPGCAVILPGDLTYIQEAVERRKATNGGRPPGFWEWDIKTGEHDNGKDHVLARLLWLEFWIEWALKNCKNPIIENT